MVSFDLIVLHFGGIVLQTKSYSRKYSDMALLSDDVASIIVDCDNPVHWDDNNPNERIVYDYHEEDSGEVRWLSNHDVESFINSGDLEQRNTLESLKSDEERQLMLNLLKLFKKGL